jgi:pyruvate/2-oxoglutarate dehydrogenase complex dihydrolipoamide acyltransferase (E2) component
VSSTDLPEGGARINGVAVARSIPLRGPQKIVAERMAESRRTTAWVTAMAEADAVPLLGLLNRLREKVPELSLTHLLIKATAICLRRHPRLNATLADDAIHELAEVNLSVALSLPSDDLQIAVIRDADEKPLTRIAEELGALQERAAADKLKLGDVRRGTFTLSNYGMLRNVVWATPIITPGQVGVLGVARAVRRVVPDESGTSWTVRSVLPLALTYDHRVVNGVPAGRFLDDMTEMIATDDWIEEEDRA